jgi:hypothetical protein
MCRNHADTSKKKFCKFRCPTEQESAHQPVVRRHSFAVATLFHQHEHDKHSENNTEAVGGTEAADYHVTAAAVNGNEDENQVHFTFSPQTAKQTMLDTVATDLASHARIRHDVVPETEEAKIAYENTIVSHFS